MLGTESTSGTVPDVLSACDLSGAEFRYRPNPGGHLPDLRTGYQSGASSTWVSDPR